MSKKFFKEFSEYLLNSEKVPCEICKVLTPHALMMSYSRTDDRLCCASCGVLKRKSILENLVRNEE